MATAIAMMIGGALVNAVAFSGSSFLFSSLRKKEEDAERKRHDLALEQLTKARDEWSRKRTAYLDYVNTRLRNEAHAKQTFNDIDKALQEYNIMTGRHLKTLAAEPKLSDFYVAETDDFYTPTDDQKIKEFIFLLLSLGLITIYVIN